jgi:hypothetical protein
MGDKEMNLKAFWKLLFLIAICSASMVVCLVLHALTGYEIFRTVGLSLAVAGVGILLLMVYSLRRVFAGSTDGFGERTWRSYK